MKEDGADPEEVGVGPLAMLPFMPKSSGVIAMSTDSA